MTYTELCGAIDGIRNRLDILQYRATKREIREGRCPHENTVEYANFGDAILTVLCTGCGASWQKPLKDIEDAANMEDLDED